MHILQKGREFIRTSLHDQIFTTCLWQFNYLKMDFVSDALGHPPPPCNLLFYLSQHSSLLNFNMLNFNLCTRDGLIDQSKVVFIFIIIYWINWFTRTDTIKRKTRFYQQILSITPVIKQLWSVKSFSVDKTLPTHLLWDIWAIWKFLLLPLFHSIKLKIK